MDINAVKDLIGTFGLAVGVVILLVWGALTYYREYFIPKKVLELETTKNKIRAEACAACTKRPALEEENAKLKKELELLEQSSDIMMNLHNHYFFTNMRRWMNSGIDNLKIKDPFKSMVFKDLLRIKFRVFYDLLMEVAHKPLSELNDLDFSVLSLDLLEKGIIEYKKAWDKEGIPTLVQDKFGMIHESRILGVITSIKDIAGTSFYDNNVIRFAEMLGTYNEAFSVTIRDAQLALNQINGDLIGLEYKGIKNEGDIAHVKFII